jgi:hypothetical protein
VNGRDQTQVGDYEFENWKMYGILPALLACTTVAGDDLRSCTLKHLGVLDCTFDVWEDAKLCGDGNGEVLVKDVDCDTACISTCVQNRVMYERYSCRISVPSHPVEMRHSARV